MMQVNEARPLAPPRTYMGRCHCGAVRYEVELDASALSGTCAGSVWERGVPASRFRLLFADENLSGHQFSARGGHDFFCERCGVRTFSRHHAELPDREYYIIDLRGLG